MGEGREEGVKAKATDGDWRNAQRGLSVDLLVEQRQEVGSENDRTCDADHNQSAL